SRNRSDLITTFLYTASDGSWFLLFKIPLNTLLRSPIASGKQFQHTYRLMTHLMMKCVISIRAQGSIHGRPTTTTEPTAPISDAAIDDDRLSRAKANAQPEHVALLRLPARVGSGRSHQVFRLSQGVLCAVRTEPPDCSRPGQ